GESPELLGHPTLTEQTLRAFRTYINETDARNAKSLASGNFLWIDDQDQRARAAAYLRLKHGEILIERIKNTGPSTQTRGGMIQFSRSPRHIAGLQSRTNLFCAGRRAGKDRRTPWRLLPRVFANPEGKDHYRRAEHRAGHHLLP